MTTKNINSDGIAQFFQAILGGGKGNTSALIEADLARRKGLGLDAAAANTAADTAFTTGPKTENMNAQTASEVARALGLNADAAFTAGPKTENMDAQTASELARRLGIDADTAYTAGPQTNLTNAQTGAETALAGSRNADTRQTDTETSVIAAEQEAQLAIAEIMASPEFNSPDPTVYGPARQKIAAIANLYAGGSTRENIGGVLAGDAYGNADRGDAQGFSSALLGTGTVANSGATPQGTYVQQMHEAIGGDVTAKAEADRLAMTIAGNKANNTANNDAALAREMLNFTQPIQPGTRYDQPGGGRQPLSVSTATVNGFAKDIQKRIEAQYPGAVLPPELLSSLADEAALEYSTTRNSSLAIDKVMKSLSTETEDLSWLPTGDTTTITQPLPGMGGAGAPAPAQAPAASSGANAVAGAIAGAPPAPAPAQAPAPIPQVAPTVANANSKIPAGAVMGKDVNGVEIYQDPTTGKWFYP